MDDLIIFGLGVLNGVALLVCVFGWWIRSEMAKSLAVYVEAVDVYSKAVDAYVASPDRVPSERPLSPEGTADG